MKYLALFLLLPVSLGAHPQDRPVVFKKGDVLSEGMLRVAEVGAADGKPYSVVLENAHSDTLIQKVIIRWYDKKGRLVRKGPIQRRELKIEKGKAVRLTSPAPFVISGSIEFVK